MRISDDMHINLKKTGENIKALMDNKEISAKTIQKKCGFSTRNTIYKWLKGACLPSIDNLVILAELLETNVDDLLIKEE